MDNLLETLEKRFTDNAYRHKDLLWSDVKEVLENNDELMASISWMEETGGMPDVFILQDARRIFVDLSDESPEGRRSVCYDKKARTERKKNAPESSAQELCQEHCLKMLTEEIYKEVQLVEHLDLKTSSWLETPQELRELGGAIFGDKRYGRTFIYHNGADSYYSARGFRAYIEF